MKRRTLALLLAAALALSALGATVLAAEGDAPATPQAEETHEPRQTPEEYTALAGAASGDVQSAQEEDQPEEDEPIEEYIPDPIGSISFANLERRMREGNLNVLSLEENIQAIQSIDYDRMQDDLRDGLNAIASAQWSMIVSVPMLGSMMAASMDAQYNALRETFDDIKDGKLQADNADLIWQLENAQDQVIMAGETLYIAVLDLERTNQGLDRQLEALDRTLEELELRYQLGHISSQTLKQTKAGRTALVSGQQTLQSNIETYKTQLELLVGAELTGEIQLGALPQVTSAQLNEMDLEADLEAAKEASYSLYEAKQTLDDAKEDYRESGGPFATEDGKYEYRVAKHQWQAAQYNYNATVQNFEMSFRTLYLQVKDYKQVLDAAKTALAVERDNCSAAQLKYSQGNLSKNAMLEAEDKVKEAQETVDGAAIDLFAAYHNYRWAVDYGILN